MDLSVNLTPISSPEKPMCSPLCNSILANLTNYRFSNGPAAYFYDAVEELLLSTFESELQADFDYFVSLSVTTPRVSGQPKGVDQVGIT